MNKKGTVLGKGLISFIVILISVFLAGFFMILSGIVFELKQPSSVGAIGGILTGQQNQALFNEIEITGEKMSIAHGLIKARVNEDNCANILKLIPGDPNNPVTPEERNALILEKDKCFEYMAKVKEAIRVKLAGENIGSERMCFIIFNGIGRPVNPKLGSNGEDIFFVFANGEGKHGSVTDMARHYDSDLLNNLEFSAGKYEFDMHYYYGRCLNEK